MALNLRVISEHRQPAGGDSVTFGVDGGSIGRAADNDWVLPDPMRYVSAHHARVHFHDGSYYVEDISTNGIYVNDEAEPLAKQEPNSHRLREGDVLRIGEYHIRVRLGDTDGGDSAVMPSRIVALHPVGAVQTDIGAVLDLDDLLAVDPAGDGFGPGEAEPRAAQHAPGIANPRAAAAPVASAPEASLPPLVSERAGRSEPSDEMVARRMTRLARSPGRDTDSGGVSAHDPALQSFCRGAGIKPEQLPVQAQGLLHLVGQLLRESLVGLKDVERAHGQLRERFGIKQAPVEGGVGPSLGQSTVEELLLSLIREHHEHSLDAVRWLRERHDEVKGREQAVAQAMRAALLELIRRLDPAELESRFVHPPGEAAGSRHWEQFTAFYRSLRGPADQLPHTFVEAFAEAYKDALRPSTVDIAGGTGVFRSLDKSR